MTINTCYFEEKKRLVISIDEYFNFSSYKTFRECYSQYTSQGMTYILDLSNTEYVDSSALGMILLLKEHTQFHASKLILSEPSYSVSKILEIAQFHHLMVIEKSLL